MSMRLQVVLDEAEVELIRRIAAAQHRTVSDWVREALRAARREYPTAEAGRKVQVVREAITHAYPTGNIDELLAEIDKGGGAGVEP